MTASPETGTTTPEISFSDAEKAAYSLQAVEQWRTRQMGILNGLREATTDPLDSSYVDAFRSSIEEQLDEYLREQGIDESSGNYADIKQAYRDASIDKVNDTNWYTSSVARGETGSTPSGRDAFADLAHERLATIASPIVRAIDQAMLDEAYDMNDQFDSAIRNRAHDEALDMNRQFDEQARLDHEAEVAVMHTEALDINEKFDDLGNSREEWATVSAKRQGKMFDTNAKQRDETRDKYTEALRALGVAQLQDVISDDDDETTKNAKVIEYLFNEQRKLRASTTEKLNSTKIGKFVEWMNKGSKMQRFGKAALIGVAAAGTSGLITLAAGAGIAAGVAGGATAAAIGTGRFVRGFARADRRRGMTTAEEEFTDRPVELEDSDDESIEERFNVAAAVYDEAFEEDTKKEQKKRQKSFAMGVLAVGVGAGVGYAVSEADSATGYVKDKFNGLFGIDDSPVDTDDTPAIVDVDKDGIPDGEDSLIDSDGDGIANKDEARLDADNDGVIDAKELAWGDFNPEARIVEQGEGWYQTFGEMGIPESHWEDVLETAGPKLAEQDWAYFDESANEWRISQPGELPDEALEIIAESSKRDGFDLAA